MVRGPIGKPLIEGLGMNKVTMASLPGAGPQVETRIAVYAADRETVALE